MTARLLLPSSPHPSSRSCPLRQRRASGCPSSNGKDLSGWTIKIAKRPLGENFANNLPRRGRHPQGQLRRLREVRRAVWPSLQQPRPTPTTSSAWSIASPGKMMADAPKYVNLNSGVMLHAQPPQSLRFDQGFPASLEMAIPRRRRQGRASNRQSLHPRHSRRDGRPTRHQTHRQIQRSHLPR